MSLFVSAVSKQLYTIACKQNFLRWTEANRRHPFRVTSFLSNYTLISRFCSSGSTWVTEPETSSKLNCNIHILTPDGALRVYTGPFDRAQICEEYGLVPRDLQKIDTDLHINVPKIDVRSGKFIGFSFRRHRGVIQSDRSVFFLPSSDTLLSEPVIIKHVGRWEHIAQTYERNIRFVHQLFNQRFVNQTSTNSKAASVDKIPFEFKMIDIILDSVANGLKLKTQELLKEYEHVQESAYARITVVSLRQLALLKTKVDKHKRNGDLAHKSIADVLAQDIDLAGMYLTDERERKISDHIEAELLLESSAKEMAEVLRDIYDLADMVRTLESATGFMLDAVRNDLMAFEIRINIVTMAFGLGAFIVGIYGMNFTNGFEQHPYAFYVVCGSSMV
ncbi:unnamed protein product, partial [Didymodactylos carnosus]